MEKTIKIEHLLNDFAIRCFRDTADRDYIHARLAYRTKLIPQFYWSSLHCLEKYMKCTLLLNRIVSKGIKHEITTAIERLKDNNIFNIELTNQTKEFIEKLEQSARFRYLEVSWDIYRPELTVLDRAVWEIRRYCQTKTSKINCLTTEDFHKNLKSIQGLDHPATANTKIPGGYLEKVLSNKKHESRSALVWKNLYFYTLKRKKVFMPFYEMAENSPLFMNPEMIDEVIKYVFIPKEVEKAFRAKIHAKKTNKS